MQNKKELYKAILLSQRNSDFIEMFRLAAALNNSNQYRSTIISYCKVSKDIIYQQKKCEECGVQYIPTVEPVWRWKRRDIKEEKRDTEWTPKFSRDRIYLILSLIAGFLTLIKQKKFFKEIIKLSRADILIVPEDIVGNVLPLFIKTGHKHGIPTVIVPYTVCNAVEAAEGLFNLENYSLGSPFNKITGVFFKRWIYKYKGKEMLRLPFYFVWAHYFYRMSPPNPWVMNSGYANAIAVESDFMKQYYLNEGFIPEKLYIVGAIYDDVLANTLSDKHALREKLYKKHDLPQGRKMILLAVPPNQLTTIRKKSEFQDYNKALEFIADELVKISGEYNIFIRPHPNFMNIKDIFEERGLTFVEEDTASLVPLSDLYIACASATIRWAISCGIPTINYDLFEYNYDDYKSAHGVLHLNKSAEFVEILHKITSDKDFYNKVKSDQDKVKDSWGKLDGKATERIINLFNNIIADKPTKRTPTSVPKF